MNKTQYFISIMALVLVVTYGVLFAFGFVPKSLKPSFNSENKEIKTEISRPETYTRPNHIFIPKIGVDSQIEQPETRDVFALDTYLSKGAVHYPGSGSIELGNIFLFGHSTGFQVVQNQAYKTFNDLNKLESGDEIILEADGKKYVYIVNSVNLVDENEALVEFDDSKRTLTISTCNSFGAKQERWVVEADFKNTI